MTCPCQDCALAVWTISVVTSLLLIIKNTNGWVVAFYFKVLRNIQICQRHHQRIKVSYITFNMSTPSSKTLTEFKADSIEKPTTGAIAAAATSLVVNTAPSVGPDLGF